MTASPWSVPSEWLNAATTFVCNLADDQLQLAHSGVTLGHIKWVIACYRHTCLHLFWRPNPAGT